MSEKEEPKVEKSENIFKPLIEAAADHFFWILVIVGIPLMAAFVKLIGGE